jgi:hypothetical protein
MDREKFASRGRRMPEESTVFGVLIVVAGMLMLLGHRLWDCWPLWIVAVGIGKGLRCDSPSARIAASLICAAGSVLLLRNLNIIAFDSRMFWPLVIIGFGIAKLAQVLDRPGGFPYAPDANEPAFRQ